MVHGNRDQDSGCGVISTRNPCTGQKEMIGEYLCNTEGTEVVDGRHIVLSLDQLKDHPGSIIEGGDTGAVILSIHDQLVSWAGKLEHHFRDMQDIEFTVQNGRLYILECSSGKRSAKAAVKICVDMALETLITGMFMLLMVFYCIY